MVRARPRVARRARSSSPYGSLERVVRVGRDRVGHGPVEPGGPLAGCSLPAPRARCRTPRPPGRPRRDAGRVTSASRRVEPFASSRPCRRPAADRPGVHPAGRTRPGRGGRDRADPPPRGRGQLRSRGVGGAHEHHRRHGAPSWHRSGHGGHQWSRRGAAARSCAAGRPRTAPAGRRPASSSTLRWMRQQVRWPCPNRAGQLAGRRVTQGRAGRRSPAAPAHRGRREPRPAARDRSCRLRRSRFLILIDSSMVETCPTSTLAAGPDRQPALSRRLLAEAVGTGLLVTVVVGSGIAAQQLSPGNVGLQLLENSTATVFGLAVLILLFGPGFGRALQPGRLRRGLVPRPPHRHRSAPPTSGPTPSPRSSERSWGPCWPTPCSTWPP